MNFSLNQRLLQLKSNHFRVSFSPWLSHLYFYSIEFQILYILLPSWHASFNFVGFDCFVFDMFDCFQTAKFRCNSMVLLCCIVIWCIRGINWVRERRTEHFITLVVESDQLVVMRIYDQINESANRGLNIWLSMIGVNAYAYDTYRHWFSCK